MKIKLQREHFDLIKITGEFYTNETEKIKKIEDMAKSIFNIFDIIGIYNKKVTSYILIKDKTVKVFAEINNEQFTSEINSKYFSYNSKYKKAERVANKIGRYMYEIYEIIK